jgi:hypothetical protein
LRQFIIVEQRPKSVGDDELIGFLAVTYGEGVVLVVFDKPHDLEFQLLAIGRLDDEDVAKLEITVLASTVVMTLAVR